MSFSEATQVILDELRTEHADTVITASDAQRMYAGVGKTVGALTDDELVQVALHTAYELLARSTSIISEQRAIVAALQSRPNRAQRRAK